MWWYLLKLHKMNKKNYFLLFLFFLGSFLVRAQNITVQAVDMPTSVVACGNQATFAFNVFGPLAAGSEITATLPAGSKYASLVSGDVTVTVVSATQVKFKLNNALAGAANTIKVEYKVETACSGLPADAKVKYETGAVLREVDYPMVQYSLLEVTNVSPASATIAVNATQNYTVTVKQSAATYSNNVKVVITHSTKVTLTAPVGTLTLGTPSAGSQTDVLELTGAQIAAIGDGDTLFENGETITAVVAAKLITCTTGETLGFKAAYGCGTFSHCTTGNITNAGLGQNVVGNPSLTMTQTKPARPGFSGQTDFAKFTVTNNGAGPAYNIKIRLGVNTGNTTYVPTTTSSLVINNFNVNGNVTPDDATDTVYFQYTTDPDGVGVGLEDLDGDGFYDDLAQGVSFKMEATFRAVVNATSECLINHTAYDILRWRLISDNACGIANTYDEPNNSLGTNRPFSYYKHAAVSSIQNQSTGTNSFVAGSTFEVRYRTTSDISLSKLNVGASNAIVRIYAKVPLGVIPSTSTSPSVTIGTNNSPTTTTVVLNNILSNPATGIYYYDVFVTSPTSTSLDYNGHNFILPFEVSPSCNSNSVESIYTRMEIYETSTSSTPVFNGANCINSNTFTLNCGTPIGLGISSFTLTRNTFGYTDNSLTTKVTASTPGVNLRYYLDGDKALADYKLKFYASGMQQAKVVLEYDQTDWLDNGVQDGGIKGISGTHTDPLTGVVTTSTIPSNNLSSYYTYNTTYVGADGLNKRGYTIDILKLFATGGPLQGKAATVNTLLDLSVQYKVQEWFGTPSAKGKEITGLVSYTPVTLVDNSSTIGNYAPEIARVLSDVSLTPAASTITQTATFEQCTVGTISPGYSVYNSNIYGEMFPNEIRNQIDLRRVEILIPKGLSVIPGTAQFHRYGQLAPTLVNIADPIIEYGFNINGTVNPTGLFNKLTFINPMDGSWVPIDAGYSYTQPEFRVKYQVNNSFRDYLAVYPTGTFNFVILASSEDYYNTNLDTPLQITSNLIGSTPANVKIFNYSFTSALPSVTTATNQAVWPLAITNTNAGSETIPNMWVAIEVPNNNIVPTLWEGATQIPLISYGAGKFWAQVGNVTTTVRNFEIRSNNFTVCGTDNFTVKTGWDCTGYPVDPQQGYTNQGNVTPYSQNLAFRLTTQNPSITTTSSVNASGTDTFDICNNIDESLTVTNGANGYAFEIEPTITLPVGMSFVNGSFKLTYGGTDYTINSADVTLVSGTTYKVNIYNSGAPFVSTGLPGTSSTDPKSFVLGYKVSTICTAAGNGNYTSGSRINYSVNAESGCGQALPLQSGVTVIRSQPININGAPIGKAYHNKLESLETDKTKANHHVNDEEELVVTVTNQGNPTGNFESIKILVDDAYDYVAGSTVLQAGNTFAGFTAVDPSNTVDASGQRVLEWTVPSGFLSGQTILFNFKVKATDASAMACEATHIMAMNTYVGSPATCAISGEVCNLQFPTGVEKEVSLLSFTPAIGAVINSSVFGSNAGNTTYNINYTITNQNATYVVKPQLNIKLYNDVNSDGLLDAGDTLLDTKTTVGTVAALGTLTETITGSYSGSASKLLLSYESNNTVSNICTPVVKSINAYCYKPAATTGGSVLDTKHGITALGRAGADADNWPMVRKGAWTVLEAKTKGFVINRIASTAAVNTIANPIEGMMVYDEEADCLKIYVIDTAVPANTGWKCFNTQACPD